MDSSYVVSDKTFDAIQTVFVGPTPPPATSCPDCLCIHDFFLNLWDNKGMLISGALMGGLALIIHYNFSEPMPTGILIGSGATLALLALCNSFHLRATPRYLRYSDDGSCVINQRSDSSNRGDFESFTHGSPSTGSIHRSNSPSETTLEIPPLGSTGFNPFSRT